MNAKLLQKWETGPFEAGSYNACLICSYEYGRTDNIASPAKFKPGKLFVHDIDCLSDTVRNSILAGRSFLVKTLATPAGFEPATVRLEGGCSIQLS